MPFVSTDPESLNLKAPQFFVIENGSFGFVLLVKLNISAARIQQYRTVSLKSFHFEENYLVFRCQVSSSEYKAAVNFLTHNVASQNQPQQLYVMSFKIKAKGFTQ